MRFFLAFFYLHYNIYTQKTASKNTCLFPPSFVKCKMTVFYIFSFFLGFFVKNMKNRNFFMRFACVFDISMIKYNK